MPPDAEDLDLADLLGSWTLALRAARKSPETLDSYRTGVLQFIAYCERTNTPQQLTLPNLNAFTVDILERGAEAATARSRHMSVRYFSAWLASPEAQVLDRDGLIGAKPPKLDEKLVVPLTVEEIAALLATCKGTRFVDRRDDAMIRFMLETTARAAETINMRCSEAAPRDGTAIIRRGKGGKGRVVAFSPQCGVALDRYMRIRKKHRLADGDQLWLGSENHTFSYDGLWRTLNRRAEQAALVGFHPHRMRHTAATRWLEAGGTQDGLMAMAGWSSPAMLHRYVKATASARAVQESRRLNLGEF
jgi:site-specific recombinase XerD